MRQTFVACTQKISGWFLSLKFSTECEISTNLYNVISCGCLKKNAFTHLNRIVCESMRPITRYKLFAFVVPPSGDTQHALILNIQVEFQVDHRAFNEIWLACITKRTDSWNFLKKFADVTDSVLERSDDVEKQDFEKTARTSIWFITAPPWGQRVSF